MFLAIYLNIFPVLRIRLTRVGRRNQPKYRIVVAEHARPVKGKFLDILGHYNPQSTEVSDFIFALQECKKNGTDVKCSFLITNKVEDVILEFYGKCYRKSRLFDNFGNEYISHSLRLANCSDDCSCRMLLISDVPTKATISFRNIAKEAEFASLVDLFFRTTSSNEFRVHFRNVQLTTK